MESPPLPPSIDQRIASERQAMNMYVGDGGLPSAPAPRHRLRDFLNQTKVVVTVAVVVVVLVFGGVYFVTRDKLSSYLTARLSRDSIASTNPLDDDEKSIESSTEETDAGVSEDEAESPDEEAAADEESEDEEGEDIEEEWGDEVIAEEELGDEEASEDEDTAPVAGGGPVNTPVTATPTTKITKLLVFVEENQSYNEMMNSMPYIASLAKKYAYANNYYTTGPTTLANYLSIAAGSTYSVTDNSGPSSHKLTGTTVFGQALAKGKTAASYEHSMTSNCLLSNTGSYYVKRNPWAYFTSERTSCNTYDGPFSKLDTDIAAGTLPNVGLAVPNMCYAGETCSLSKADTWLKEKMAKIFNAPDWKSGRLAVVITSDQDDGKSGGKVLTVVIHQSQSAKVVAQKLTHYSLSRLFSEVSGTTPLKNAASAPSMANTFSLPL